MNAFEPLEVRFESRDRLLSATKSMLPEGSHPRSCPGSRRADPKIGIVPAYNRPFEPGQQEPEILAEHFEIHGLIGHHGIDTKAQVYGHPGCRAWNHLEEGAFLSVGSMNCQRSRTPGGFWAAVRREVDARGRCSERSRKTSRSVS